MRYFVIKRKSDSRLFPATGRGSTWAEFSMRGTPRLFSNLAAAKNCLRWWLEGTCSMVEHAGYDGDYDCDLRFDPRPERKAEDYEIVPVNLKFAKT